MSADVSFTVTHRFDQPPKVVWDEMIDWKGHEDWIPLTTVEIHSEPADEVGGEFTAFTGVWKLGLPDRMRVSRLAWDEASSTGECRVEKLGPVLQGEAGFTVTPDGEGGTEGGGSVVTWIEDVTVKYVPGPAAGITSRVGAAGFRQAMKSLAKVLARR